MVSATLLQQLILLSSASVLLVVVHRWGRGGALGFSFTIMWSGIALVGLVSVVILPWLNVIGDSVGVIPAALLAGAAAAILGAIALVLSLRLSRLEARQQDLVQAFGLANSVPDVPAPGSGTGVLAVVPALNEQATIGEVVRGLADAGLPVLVVDDGSTDFTASVARDAGATVMSLPLNLGVGGALRAGFAMAVQMGHREIVQCDADGQHPPEAVLAVIGEQQRTGADLVIGSRFLAPDLGFDQSMIRRIATASLSRIASRYAGCRITDSTSGLRAIRSPLLEELARAMPPHFLGDTFEVNVMAGRAGYRIGEIGVRMHRRRSGVSSATTSEAVRLTIRAVLVVLLGVSNATLRPREPRSERR